MIQGAAARVAAARILHEVLHRGRSLKAALGQTLPTLADHRDRALVEACVLTALRQQARFNAALNHWMPRPLGQRDGDLRALLLIGLAQLEMGLPAHAALAATVDAARAIKRTHQAGMVNALLRRAQREGIPDAPAEAAWPHWLAQHVRNEWPQQADAIFAASAAQPPLWLRVNTRWISRQDYLALLADTGITAQPHPAFADALRLDTTVSPTQLPGFDAGLVSIQDGAAQAVADALSPAAGARILDACAAPGGKAAHLAERYDACHITALDIDARRVRRMHDTFTRLRLEVATRCADAAQPNTWWDGVPFDAILIDAPCSATGIVRRQPDVLLHRRNEDISALQHTQAQLLDALWPLLTHGGTLVYATCSILHVENAEQIKNFLARQHDAALLPLDARFGLDTGFGHQRFPGDDNMDGFFIAKLQKHAA